MHDAPLSIERIAWLYFLPVLLLKYTIMAVIYLNFEDSLGLQVYGGPVLLVYSFGNSVLSERLWYSGIEYFSQWLASPEAAF